MLARSTLLIAATFSAVGAHAADVAKPLAPAPVRDQKVAAPVVLAAAEIDRPADSNTAVPTPQKRPRAARVTTCRCGESPSSN